jgi:hypothetical protein
MRRAFLLVAMWLVASLSALADPGTDAVVAAMRKTNWDVGPEIVFLEKTTRFVVPDHSVPRLQETGPYGGAKFAYIFGRDMLKYFEANGYPNLRQSVAGGSTDQLDEIAKKYTFAFVYEGPDDGKAWNMFINYSSLIRDELFHWGWASKSGQGHFTVTTTPKATAFSATSDGTTYSILNPIQELPTSQWGKLVKPVLDKFGTQANRI